MDVKNILFTILNWFNTDQHLIDTACIDQMLVYHIQGGQLHISTLRCDRESLRSMQRGKHGHVLTLD